MESASRTLAAHGTGSWPSPVAAMQLNDAKKAAGTKQPGDAQSAFGRNGPAAQATIAVASSSMRMSGSNSGATPMSVTGACPI